MDLNFSGHSHRRVNPLTGDWVLVSPHRSKRPWQGKTEEIPAVNRPAYDHHCYLCPGNERTGGVKNPHYDETFVFTNDFSALGENYPEVQINENNLLVARSESGICRVICFSPRHDLSLPQMTFSAIVKVIDVWIKEYKELGSQKDINYVQIFENKGEMMGCSNPHPHGQIWAESAIPLEVEKEDKKFGEYFTREKRSLLSAYAELEIQKKERVVFQNDSFLTVVPFWAVWPYETLIIPKRQMKDISELNAEEKQHYADAIQSLTKKYDHLFNVSFPYSAGIHQAPTDGKGNEHWHWHMHFYPPLLRSATIKKFMVGYEMMGNPQRDITPEFSAEKLRSLPL